MPQQIENEIFVKTIRALLEETFEKVSGIYLDSKTSLPETLADLSAAEASRPISNGGTSIAGQVFHLRFYIKVLNDYMENRLRERVDWSQSWLLKSVTDSEWDSLRGELKGDYARLLAHLDSVSDWNDEKRLGGALAIIVHTAYHLGAIRQILRAIKA